MGRRCFAHGPMDARGSFRGRPVLAPARDRCKSARRRTGYDRDRIDARYRIADDRGAQGRWAVMSEPQTRLRRLFAELGDVAGEELLPTVSTAKNYRAISITYEFAVLF